MVEWLRKNSFIKDLRAYLKRFRIVEMKTEVLEELKEIAPYSTAVPGEQPGAAVIMGQKGYEPTGRFVIQIRLTGFWRQK